ncbi:DNA-methyltransferase [Tumebacillus permanentifrigoris]|uniref:Methyltransferase n=1 Tax=Tumebacillus permanentifrigoris TaxID=378543 RepID=A0A316DCY6_9BACL|nr:site-specific DNA-methyltransferase [Tumebacillus permanentifrigoris]PWK16047.1 site-specific DNA-methyltransferase (adenine-specific)/modification methylase [Tumebacillus permanentifrigoris]
MDQEKGDDTMNDITIANEDCRDMFRRIESESVDLALTDPPYGIDFYSNARRKSDLATTKGILNDGKGNLPFLEEVAAELYRVLKPNTHLYWFTRWDKVEEHLPMLRRCGFSPKNAMIWVKGGGGMGDLTGAYAPDYEIILFLHKGRRPLNEVEGKKRHSDVVRFTKIASNNLLHSHQKPTALLEFLIRKSSSDGDMVIDPFLGSGSTAIAARNTGRRFVGCELSPDIYAVAKAQLQTC